MANTFELISSVTVGSGGAASIDFTSIPATYTDLVLKLSARTTDTGTFGEAIIFEFNGSSTSLSTRRLYGQGNGGLGSLTGTIMYAGMGSANGQTASTFGNSEIYIPNYAGSTNKSSSSDGVSENNGTNNQMQLSANLWSNTAAITSISIKTETAKNFMQYSTAYLYGVKNA